MLKKILLALLVILIVAQFFRPAKNQSEGPQANHIGTKYDIPADVKPILEKACYDCHSNNTKYPWYNNFQPVSGWLALHVKKGKKELNFDEFTNKPPRYQYRKMEEVEEMVKEGEMPLPSYTWTHKDAILTDAEKNGLYAWVRNIRSQMEATYPKESLAKPAAAQGEKH